ncbi:MAG: pilus assembly protein N-terminal domain-containing protein, partial [Pseudomonadota bacterium]
MHTGRKNCLSLAVRLVATVVVLVGMVAADAVLNAANANGRNVTSHGRSGGMALDIPINKSDVLRSSRAFFEVAVGNPEIADVQVLGERSLYVFGRKFGSTSVTLSDNAGRIIAVVDVNVIHDVGRVKRMLHQLMPKERIAVRAANDGLVLSGTVSSSAIAANAMTIAERFAPDAVSNLMNVQGSQQVMLAVKFVEMRRDAIKRLGVNSAGSVGAGAVDIITDLTTALISPASTAQIGLGLTTGRTDIVGFLDMLEDRGVVRTLAEPTLVAMSGDSADFLAGGEFPVPVGATDGE